MKTAQEINSSFRKEIRNRQKQALFNSIRSKYTQISEQPMISNSNTMVAQQQSNEESMLLRLNQQIKGGDGVRVCNRIIDEGLHHRLLDNLKKNLHLESTLHLLSTILTKQKIKVAHKLIKLGLIELILKQTQTRAYVDICMNILANVVFENVEYAEMMLENNVQLGMMGLVRDIVLREGQGQRQGGKLEKVDQDTGYVIMWAMSALLQVENTLPYKQAFLNILNFTLQLHKKTQLYPNLLLQIIFLVGYSFREQTQQASASAINAILAQTSTQSKYIENLFIVIKLLTPFEIDYGKICALGIMGQGKLVSYCVRILERCAGVYGKYIPTNFQWWERLYLKLQKPQDIENYTLLLKKSKLTSQFIYRILADILENYTPQYLTLTNEVLSFLNDLLSENTNKSPQEKAKIKFYFKSYNLVRQVQRLYEGKNGGIQRKCQYLLTLVNMM